MQWTSQQRQVIEQRNRDVLVSAAAGSGKTAVLVERIISRVCDRDDPVDIDRILVVTFTKAAAREMKERIFRALEKRSAQYPNDRHLALQTALVHNARISTIDGFCQYLVRNYFNEIGVDPNRRIADEGELVLLKNDVMESMLEEWYQKEDQDFYDLSDAFSGRDRDDGMVDMIFSLYSQSLSYPYPKDWIRSVIRPYEEDEIKEAGWLNELTDYAKRILSGLCEEATVLFEELEFAGHPYTEAVQSDLVLIKKLLSLDKYNDWYETLNGMKFAALSRKKLKDEDPDEREQLKNRRNEIKKEIALLQKEFFSKPPEEIIAEMEVCRPFVEMLSGLAIEFYERYQLAKESRGIMDFSDLEHFALSILVDSETGERTEAARKLSEYYSEVMIDEYQDSNFLQEMILSAIASKDEGAHNYFMVGDVKQSIYRFRQARPDIFMGKYIGFQSDNKNEVLIGLDRNFRSRHEVTDSVNTVFKAVMHRDMGGVEYDESQALTCGAVGFTDPSEDNEDMFCTEILIGDEDEAKSKEFDDKTDYEATMIAMRIRSLLEEGMVTDGKNGELRSVRLSDIAVLHRSANAYGRIFQDVLKSYGISSAVMATTGYFTSAEIETLLALLKILNNPTQDIPLCAVMRSMLFGFSDEELAGIRACYPDERFYNAVSLYASEQNDEHVRSFYDRIQSWRKEVPFVCLYELLSKIIRETGYLAYVSALPEGNIRRKNIEKLLELSISYENSSYKGLFYFVRYIERLRTYEQDMGQAEAEVSDDVVSIMTIHKSKGLEFPIVFVAGCGQNFRNNTDRMVINPDLGLGIHAVYRDERVRINTQYRRFLSRMNTLEERGEEQRVLYVAMTRAKEKLIMTGIIPKARELYDQYEGNGCRDMSLGKRVHARNYLQWIMPAAAGNKNHFKVEIRSIQDFIFEETAWQIGRNERLESLHLGVNAYSDEDMKRIREQISFVYPHKVMEDARVKYSVSELKRRAMEKAFDDESVNLFEAEEQEAYVPMFISGKKAGLTSAERGTAVHRYLECFDYTIENADSRFDEQLNIMQKSGKITEEEARILPKHEIVTFLRSDLACRMHRAACDERLEKEAAFVMADLPSHFMEEFDSEKDLEPILVQGIIDVFFEEDDGIVLLDYKTDRVKSGEELISRYEKQMKLYADALDRTHKMKVKEIWLYSFAMGRGIRVEPGERRMDHV